ncbi:hypothetical protein HanXRQr2_Chr09g0401521 [Helianthus annuus]|uniref:Uncharacterized protein n=1 Tax=Helianthus annuus TaxID=4232 RepID=A0A251TYS0_HELAN|nr:hypothetical protein HanXRQr2_Chr09g0401521 [Helianthus annuus]KAJ0535616.1 hypothetical protein HanIR_Chr09g0432571 [Helianthus annuus]KAJ0894284.1 hypothetical protein HanPSC8_Chr09g0387321 [Helianthus annuus]
MKMSSSSSHKAFTIVAIMFLLLSTGFSRNLMRSTTSGDGFASPPSPFEESEGKSREMIELDYDDAGPNTNRSGVLLPTPEPAAPTPQP